MKPRLSCTDFSFPKLSHDQALGVIALLGLKGVDIGMFEGHGHLKPSKELRQPEHNAEKLRRRLDAHGLKPADLFLQIHAGFDAMAVNHLEASVRHKARNLFLRALDHAAALGTDHFTLLPGVAFPGETRESSLSRAAEELTWRVESAKPRRIQVAVEPHVGSLIDTPERAMELAGRVPGLGFTLDYAHFTTAGIPDSRIDPLLSRATHLHARCARKGRLQCPLKENTIGFETIIRTLATRRFKGWIALEYVWIDWQHCNEVDVLSETVMLRELITGAAGK